MQRDNGLYSEGQVEMNYFLSILAFRSLPLKWGTPTTHIGLEPLSRALEGYCLPHQLSQYHSQNHCLELIGPKVVF